MGRRYNRFLRYKRQCMERILHCLVLLSILGLPRDHERWTHGSVLVVCLVPNTTPDGAPMSINHIGNIFCSSR